MKPVNSALDLWGKRIRKSERETNENQFQTVDTSCVYTYACLFREDLCRGGKCTWRGCPDKEIRQFGPDGRIRGSASWVTETDELVETRYYAFEDDGRLKQVKTFDWTGRLTHEQNDS